MKCGEVQKKGKKGIKYNKKEREKEEGGRGNCSRIYIPWAGNRQGRPSDSEERKRKREPGTSAIWLVSWVFGEEQSEER